MNMDQNIIKCKLEHCIREHAKEVVFEITKDIYYNHPSTKKGTMDLKHVCKILKAGSKNNIPKYVFGKNFPDKFKYNFETADPQDLDISFCFIMILNLLINKIELPNDLKTCIEVIQHMRNRICHDRTFKETELNQLKNELISRLKELNLCMQDIIAKKIHIKFCSDEKNSKEIDFELCNGKKENYYQTLIESKIKAINTFWKTSWELKESESQEHNDFKMLVSGCQKELKKIYGNVITAPDLLKSDSKIFVQDVFVPVDLKCENHKNIHWYDIFTTNKDKSILLLGDHGQGKTILCKMLISSWLHSFKDQSIGTSNDKKRNSGKRLNLDKYDLVLVIESKDAEEIELVDYLKKILPKTLEDIDDSVYHFLAQLDILVIIDAVNEKRKDLVESCLDSLNDKRFFITTRNDYSSYAYALLKHYNFDNQYQTYHLEVSEKDRKSFCRKYLPNPDDYKKFEVLVENLPVHLQDVFDLSLTSVLLNVWVKSGKTDLKFVTLGSLFMRLVKCVKESAKNISESKYKDLENLIDHVISQIAKDCYQNCIKEKSECRYIDKTLIQNIQTDFKKKGFTSDETEKVLSSLFLVGFSINIRNQEHEGCFREYEFLHETQAKWFAAVHAKTLLTKKNSEMEVCKILRGFWIKKQCNDVVSFTIGLLNAEGKLKNEVVSKIFKKKEIDKIFEDKNHHFLWKIISETLEEKQQTENSECLQPNSEMCEFLKNICILAEWKLDENNVVSALNMLRFTPILPTSMDIKMLDLHETKFFLSTLEKLNNTYVDKSEEREKVKVSLHFNQQMQNTETSSDDVLKNLSFWADLVKFSGFLRERGIRSLKMFENLAELKLLVIAHKTLDLLCNVCNEKTKLKEVTLCLIKEHLSNTPTSGCSYEFQNAKLAFHFNFFKSWRNISKILEYFKSCDVTEVVIQEANKVPTENEAKSLCIPEGGKLVVMNGKDIDEKTVVKIKTYLKCELCWNEYG